MNCYQAKFKLSEKKAASYQPFDSIKDKYPKLELTIYEDFTLDALNSEIWRYNFAYGDAHLPYRHRDDNIRFRNGCANFMLNVEDGMQTAGILVSMFTIKCGLIQVRAKFPCTQAGQLDAIWSFGENGMPEHDIAEWNGSEVSVTEHWGYDYKEGLKKRTRNGDRKAKWFKPEAEFYIYELELTPYQTIYRINGIETLKTAASNNEQHIILNSGILDSKYRINGLGMVADWVRVYEPKL